MTLFVRLLRLGRIYKPKYDIIVYKNYKPVGRLGVLHLFKDLTISNSKVKVLRLDIDQIRRWQMSGLILPKWLSVIVDPLFISQKYDILKINHDQLKSHKLLSNCGGLMPMKFFSFIRGKTHARAILKSQHRKNEK